MAMKTRSSIGRSLLVLLVLAVIAGCASTRTQESTGQYVDDSAITAKVKTAILEDPSLKVFQIGVETYKGVVQLSGFVNSSEMRDRATVVASAVSGVKSVKNSLLVK
jgi:hyperosmotically inducible periplasmic protein